MRLLRLDELSGVIWLDRRMVVAMNRHSGSGADAAVLDLSVAANEGLAERIPCASFPTP